MSEDFRLQRLESDVNDLKTFKATSLANQAAQHERDKHIDERFDRLETRANNIDNNTTWIVRLILGAILMAIISFLMGGGFDAPS